MKKSTKNIFQPFNTEVLSEQEMSVVLGGKRRKGKSKDKDVYDLTDE